jgi:hypothetical protein
MYGGITVHPSINDDVPETLVALKGLQPVQVISLVCDVSD